MGSAPLYKVDPHRARSIRPQLLQLQPLRTNLQGELSLGLGQRQTQTFSPLPGQGLIGLAQRFDFDTTACCLLTHLKTRSKI